MIEYPPSLIPDRVIFIRSKDNDDAVTRLSLLPLCDELSRQGVESVTIHPRQGLPRTETSDCIVFQYNDIEAVAALRKTPKLESTVVCIGSDIYSFSRYAELHDLVSYFLVPTDMHRLVLSGMVCKPVYTLPETIDRLAAGSSRSFTVATFPTKTSKRVCWFGYAESFNKGMASLVPTIKAALSRGHIESFTLVLNTEHFHNRYGFDLLPYSLEDFPRIASSFDYSVLSHFPLDLRINSLIKSPNKAITSLFSGMIPLASNTPSYGSVFSELGLSHFLFSSPNELGQLLSNLDPASDSRFLQEAGTLTTLEKKFGQESITHQFLHSYRQFVLNDQSASPDLPLGLPPSMRREYFSNQLRALGRRGLSALISRVTRIGSFSAK